MNHYFAAVFTLVVAASAVSAQGPIATNGYDVVVYGATTGGVVEKRVNQRLPQGAHVPFVSLGVFEIAEGGGTAEVAGSPDAGGYVIADAVQRLP